MIPLTWPTFLGALFVAAMVGATIGFFMATLCKRL